MNFELNGPNYGQYIIIIDIMQFFYDSYSFQDFRISLLIYCS